MRFQNAPFSSYYKRIVFYASTLAFSSPIWLSALKHSKTHIWLEVTYPLICACLFVLRTKTFQNAYLTWSNVPVNLRMPVRPVRIQNLLSLWCGLLAWVLRCEPLERTNALRINIPLRRVISERVNNAILSSERAIKQVNNIKNIFARPAYLF